MGGHLDLPTVKRPVDVLVLPGYLSPSPEESGHRVLARDQPRRAPDPRLGTRSAQSVRRFGQRPLLPRWLTTSGEPPNLNPTTSDRGAFAPHRDTLESFVACINAASSTSSARSLAEDVVLHGPFGDDPVVGRETAVETVKTVNGLSSDDAYMEVLGGETTTSPLPLQVRTPRSTESSSSCSTRTTRSPRSSIFYRTCRPASRAAQPGDADRRAALGTAHRTGRNEHRPALRPHRLDPGRRAGVRRRCDRGAPGPGGRPGPAILPAPVHVHDERDDGRA